MPFKYPDHYFGAKHLLCCFNRKVTDYFLGVACQLILAERVGFEPTDAYTSQVFKTRAIDHSAISPNWQPQMESNHPAKGQNLVPCRWAMRLYGAPEEARTLDLPLKRRLLYHLSYWRIYLLK